MTKIGTAFVAVVLGLTAALFGLNLWLDADPVEQQTARAPLAATASQSPQTTPAPSPSPSPSPSPAPSPTPTRSIANGTKVVSTSYIEKAIKRRLDAKSSITTIVVCPGTVALKKGTVISCSVYDANGGSNALQTADVTITDAAGRFGWATR